MPIAHRLTQVIVIPRNGYINRLQAWASAAILASDIGVELRVAWQPEVIAPALADDLFDPSLIRDQFVSPEAIESIVGGAHSKLPRYLTRNDDRDLLTLAGHDRGEQAFMDPLRDLLQDPLCPSTLLVIAGGKFALPSTVNFRRRRGEFYRSVPWHSDIQIRIERILRKREPYCSLHIRGTDRSREAPTTKQIARALIRLRNEGAPRSLFVSADTEEARQEWISKSDLLGFQPWTADHDVRHREDRSSGQDAIVDWLILTGAVRSIYSAESSFGEESTVASTDQQVQIPLTASGTRRSLRSVNRWLRAATRRARRAIAAT